MVTLPVLETSSLPSGTTCRNSETLQALPSYEEAMRPLQTRLICWMGGHVKEKPAGQVVDGDPVRVLRFWKTAERRFRTLQLRGSGFRVWDLGLRALDLSFGAPGLGFGHPGLVFECGLAALMRGVPRAPALAPSYPKARTSRGNDMANEAGQGAFGDYILNCGWAPQTRPLGN